jgi:nucleoside-diphosphate-sugar epimerase/SAM-dependent methyltransferase/quercetin dioxygenase-like cupin family protein
MKKKIIITGGLGYIGTELCRLYSGVSWYHKIIVLDRRFLSERVHELKNWNIEFFQGTILDKKFIKNILKDADVVHHLAGITDVAYVLNDINEKRDKEINEVAIKGTQNIIESIGERCKLIFPSTHVIFDGLNKVKKNLDERDSPCPILEYSKSKLANEKQIINQVKNYIILRLASVYGYSADSMRLSIVPNLFSKISSQNGTIKLFSNGNQLKSLVPLLDVVRCFKFMEENKFKNQIYNLAKDNLKIKNISYICKKINPKVTIIKTNDKIPNLGYTLSNKKLLTTGFKFLYRLEESIEEMIRKWTLNKPVKDKSAELEYKKSGEKEFIDYRGKISNFELTEPINLIGYIESKSGTVRANHFHPVQEQKCLLIKGKYVSVHKDILTKNSPRITQLVKPGEIVITKPNVAHTMVFLKDSIFLNLVRGEREHENYGITHTIPNKIISHQEKNDIIKNYKTNCRICNGDNLERIISLGFQPLANNLLNKPKEKYNLHPLELNFCKNCYNCQLSYVADPKKLFSNYLYLSSTSSSFVKHFQDAAKKYKNIFKLPINAQIIDVGSNDGIALKAFKDLGFRNILGVEPAQNIAKIANKKGLKTINGFLNNDLLKNINLKADLILASNIFAHVDQINDLTNCIFGLLKKNGIFIIEVQYLLNTLIDCTFDNIYHEHVNYWSVLSLNNFFKKHKAKIFKIEKINTHGGSIRVYVCKNSSRKIENSVQIFINKELKLGIDKLNIYENFRKKVFRKRVLFKNRIEKIKKLKKNIIGYGAPAKATVALNFYNISNEIDYIIDDNLLKVGKYVPGSGILIKKKNQIKKKSDYLLVLAWNFYKEIKKNNSNLAKKIISIKTLN